MNWKLLAFVWCVLAVLYFVIYPAVMLFLAWLFRARIIGIDFGAPPFILRFHVLRISIQLGLLPINTTFRMDRDEDSHQQWTAPTEAFSKYRWVHELPLWQQLLLITAGVWTNFAVAFVALQPHDFLHQVAVAIPNLFWGTIQPHTEGQLLLQKFVVVMDADPRRAAGILAAILATWHSIPYCPSPTYMAIDKLSQAVAGKGLPYDFNLLVALPLIAPWIAPCIGWAIAIAVFVFAR